MRPKYPQKAPIQNDRWMVSYVDVLTILLIFFLVAAAKSLELPPAPGKAGQGAGRGPGGPPYEAAAAVKRAGTNLVRAQKRLRDQGLESKLEPRGLLIDLPQAILFSSGEDRVSPMSLPTLERIAEALRDVPNQVRLIGHADTAPIHNRRFGSNWDLSMARSRKILELLSTRYGIPESRLSIVSYGPYRPAAANDTVEGRALNRRVEILIIDDSAEDIQAK